jgi:hypothetical protein
MGPSKAQWRRIWARVELWGKALENEIAQHGRPNSFGVMELAGEYGLRPRDGYYLGDCRLSELWERLGGEKFGPCPTYKRGRFYFEAPPCPECGLTNGDHEGSHPKGSTPATEAKADAGEFRIFTFERINLPE